MPVRSLNNCSISAFIARVCMYVVMGTLFMLGVETRLLVVQFACLNP